METAVSSIPNIWVVILFASIIYILLRWFIYSANKNAKKLSISKPKGNYWERLRNKVQVQVE